MSSVTKPGKHGTLHRYVLAYTDPSDEGFGESTWETWAYNLDHAVDRFYEHDPEFTEGFKVKTVARKQEGSSQHRAIRHTVSLPPGSSRR
jgi:hypothetical protein